MAYRYAAPAFTTFAIAPLVGGLVGPATFAYLLRFTSVDTGSHSPLVITNSGLTGLANLAIPNMYQTLVSTNNGGSSQTFGTSWQMSSTSVWYLVAVTQGAGTSVSRFHLWDGSSWKHQSDTATGPANPAIASSDILHVGGRATGNTNADIVCAGIKKTDSSDAAIEGLSVNGLDPWRAFGFDWLIGFDTSLQSGGLLQDQSAAGTGDEVSHSGTTTLVSDPPGWSWTGGTPTTGARSSGFLVFT